MSLANGKVDSGTTFTACMLLVAPGHVDESVIWFAANAGAAPVVLVKTQCAAVIAHESFSIDALQVPPVEVVSVSSPKSA
jgi:hypothetical protein